MLYNAVSRQSHSQRKRKIRNQHSWCADPDLPLVCGCHGHTERFELARQSVLKYCNVPVRGLAML